MWIARARVAAPSGPMTACGLSICNSNFRAPVGKPCAVSRASHNCTAAPTWSPARSLGTVKTKPSGTPPAPSSTSSSVRSARRHSELVKPLIRTPQTGSPSDRNVCPARTASSSSTSSPRIPYPSSKSSRRSSMGPAARRRWTNPSAASSPSSLNRSTWRCSNAAAAAPHWEGVWEVASAALTYTVCTGCTPGPSPG